MKILVVTDEWLVRYGGALASAALKQ